MQRKSSLPKPTPKTQDAYLHDMLEAARLIHEYMAGVSFDAFWNNSEKRDAVSLRISILGESAAKIDKDTEAALPNIPFKAIRGMRNRIAQDYSATDFKIVWAVTQKEIQPMIAALEENFNRRTST
ncbi:MAG TPA: HepT-like ribonuclease domain-containing protein [Opitutaceae bacterium]